MTSALTVWYFPDLETRFARLCCILVLSAECTRCTGGRERGRQVGRFIQMKQRKDSICTV